VSDIINGLAAKAKTNLIEAQLAEFGYLSGPGIDITVRTSTPITGDRLLAATTKAGQAFLDKFYPLRIIPLAELSKFARLTHEWGLSINTVWEPEEL
jgi:hypothetical protein